MSKIVEAEICCPACNHRFRTSLYRTLWLEDPKNLQIVLDDQLNVRECPKCTVRIPLPFGCLLVNKDKEYAIWYEPQHDSAIDSDVALYAQHMGPNSYYAKAERIHDWIRLKDKIQELEKRNIDVKVTGKLEFSETLNQQLSSFVDRLRRQLWWRRRVLKWFTALFLAVLVPTTIIFNVAHKTKGSNSPSLLVATGTRTVEEIEDDKVLAANPDKEAIQYPDRWPPEMERAIRLCQLGRFRHCYIAGELFFKKGHIDYAENVTEQGCNGGDANSCLALGLFIRVSDKEKMDTLIRKACNIDPDACYKFSSLLHFNKRHEQAIRVATLSCDDKHSKGCIWLGFYSNESNQRFSFYAKACSLNDLTGCNLLAEEYSKVGDKTKAKDLFERNCRNNNFEGCTYAGRIHDEEKNTSYAKFLFQKACSGKDLAGCCDLAEIELRLGNIAIAETNAKKGCTPDEQSCCEVLGMVNLKQKQYGAARENLNKACNSGHNSACAALQAMTKAGL